MQILNTLLERHKYNVVHPRWATPTQKLPILYYYTIQQNEGIQPTTTLLHFLFTLSQPLTQSHRLFYNATIQYTTVLQCFPFIRELPWENTTDHPIPWVCKLLVNKHPKFSFEGFPLEPSFSGVLPPNTRWGTAGPWTPWGDDVPLHPLARMSVQ